MKELYVYITGLVILATIPVWAPIMFKIYDSIKNKLNKNKKK